MGIDDRDYMRDRRRRSLNDLLGDVDRPFMPPKEGSLLLMALFWVVVAGAVYAAYTVWGPKARSDGGAGRTVARVSPPADRAPEPRARATLEQRQLYTESTVTRPAASRTERPMQSEETSAPQASATSGTIYLCKSYRGATFWAQSHCGQHRALIDSIVSVPAGVPFEQQVQIAQQQRREVAQMMEPAPAPTTAAPSAVSNKSECEALDRHIEQLDNAARQPQSAQMQDWLRDKRKAARDRQFAIRC